MNVNEKLIQKFKVQPINTDTLKHYFETKGADPNYRKNFIAEIDISFFHDLDRHNYAENIKYLINVGVPVNSVGRSGGSKSSFSPLMSTVFIGNYEVVKLMLDKGAEVNEIVKGTHPEQEGSTAFQMACVHGRHELMELLLQYGADPLLRRKDGDSAWRCFRFFEAEEGTERPQDVAECDRILSRVGAVDTKI